MNGNRATVALLFVLLFTIADRAEAGPARCDAARPLRVLFIGNSFTYVHNVPRLVEEIARSLPGPCVVATMVVSGGSTLEEHWQRGVAQAHIREGGWTHVVLNDQSTFGEGWWLEGKARVGTSGRELFEFGVRFADVIRASGAIPVFLAHWADAEAPARDQHALDAIFARVIRETAGEVADVGRAIKRMQSELPAVQPYHSDKHHLSPAGAYMEALVFYTALTKRSPAGAPSALRGPAVELQRGIVSDSIVTLVDLSDREAKAIARIAAKTSSEARQRFRRITVPPPLSAEYPNIPKGGRRLTPQDLFGHWRGTSRVLPNPAGEAVTIELTLSDSGQLPGQNALHLRTQDLHFTGPASLVMEGERVLVRAAVMPEKPPTRGATTPLLVELEGTMVSDFVAGVATIQQRFEGTTSSFDAVGRFEIRRSGDRRAMIVTVVGAPGKASRRGKR